MPSEAASDDTPRAGFVRASRLFDVRTDRRVPWDWTRGQPLAETHAEIEVPPPEGR